MNPFANTVQIKSDDELLEMVYRFDEWSVEMLHAVEQELLKRHILPDDVNTRKQQLVEEEETRLSPGKEASFIGQVIGWITILGFLGIFIGYRYAFSKVRGKYNQKSYFVYDENSRKNGSYIFYTSVSILVIEILFKILTAIHKKSF